MNTCNKCTSNFSSDVECCIKSCNGVCATFDIDDILYSIKEKISEYSKSFLDDLKYGFKCKPDTQFNINKLSAQKWVLENLSKFKNCFCDSDLQIIKEDIQTTVSCKPICKKDLIIDDSLVLEWNKNNPYCISKELWETLVYKVCGELSIKVDISTACNLIFDIYTEEKHCDLINSISIKNHEKCELDFKAQITKKDECKLEFKKLIQIHPKCNLTLHKYTKLINECNLNFDIINEIYNCNLKVQFKNSTPYLYTKSSNYCIQDLKFNVKDKSCSLKETIEKIIKNV